MKICLSTGSLFKLPLAEIFHIAKESGFDGLELLICPRISKPYDLEEAMRLSWEVLPVKGVHVPFFRFRGWQGKISSLKKAITWARVLGGEVVTFHPPNWLNLEFIFWLWMFRVKNFKQETGGLVHLSIEIMPVENPENRFSGYFLNDPLSLKAFAKKKGLALTLDTTHMATRNQDLIPFFLSIYEEGLVKNIHLSDFKPFKQHLFPGKGNLPMMRFLNLLKHLNYRELLTIEVTPNELPETEKETVEKLKILVDFIREVAG
jgi:sugar phosphate isomerase/epimerase